MFSAIEHFMNMTLEFYYYYYHGLTHLSELCAGWALSETSSELPSPSSTLLS